MASKSVAVSDLSPGSSELESCIPETPQPPLSLEQRVNRLDKDMLWIKSALGQVLRNQAIGEVRESTPPGFSISSQFLLGQKIDFEIAKSREMIASFHSFSSEKSISSQVPKSEKLTASSKSFPCQLRLEYGTLAAVEAAKKIKNLWVIVCIYGYESPLPEDDETGKALVSYFGSICGRTRDFMFGKDPFNPEEGRCAYIEVWGKEAVEKAVALTGSEVAGLKILVKPAPTYQEIYKNVPFDAFSFGSTTVPDPPVY